MRIHKITQHLWVAYCLATEHVVAHIEQHGDDQFEVCMIGEHHEPLSIKIYKTFEEAARNVH